MKIRNKIIPFVVLGLMLALLACNAALPQIGPTQAPVPTTIVELTSVIQPGDQSGLPQTEADVPRISVEDAKATLDGGGAIIVDVRSAESTRRVTLQAPFPFHWTRSKLIRQAWASIRNNGSSPTAPDQMNTRAPVRRSSYYKMVSSASIPFSAAWLRGWMRASQWSRRVGCSTSIQMKILSVDHVQMAIPPGGEEKARAFYVNLLGFREIPKPPELTKRGGSWFEAGSVRLHLGAEADFRPARKAHPAFIVDDLTALIAEVQSAGYETDTTQPPLDGYQRAHVFDPFGNRIELMEKLDT